MDHADQDLAHDHDLARRRHHDREKVEGEAWEEDDDHWNQNYPNDEEREYLNGHIEEN